MILRGLPHCALLRLAQSCCPAAQTSGNVGDTLPGLIRELYVSISDRGVVIQETVTNARLDPSKRPNVTLERYLGGNMKPS
jgi:hypothetical protein